MSSFTELLITEPPKSERATGVNLRGVVSPFRRGANDIATASDIEIIKNNIEHILVTPRGSYPWRQEFGSDLHKLLHRLNSPSTAQIAKVYVNDALAQWEPRVRVDDVDVERISTFGDDSNPNALRLILHWSLRNTRSQSTSATAFVSSVDI